jgi:hypothetical protein
VKFSPVRFGICMTIAILFALLVGFGVTEHEPLALKWFFFIITFLVQIFAMRPTREGGHWAWETKE